MTRARLEANARMGITTVDRVTSEQLALGAAQPQIARGVEQFRKAMEFKVLGKTSSSQVWLNAALASIANIGVA